MEIKFCTLNIHAFRLKCSSDDVNQVKAISQNSKSFRIQRFKFSKYHKSKSIEKATYDMHEGLETPLSSSKFNQQDSNGHENHKLCKECFLRNQLDCIILKISTDKNQF